MFTYILPLLRFSSLSHSFNFLGFAAVRPLHTPLGTQRVTHARRTAVFTLCGPLEVTKCKSVPSKHFLKTGSIAILVVFFSCWVVWRHDPSSVDLSSSSYWFQREQAPCPQEERGHSWSQRAAGCCGNRSAPWELPALPAREQRGPAGWEQSAALSRPWSKAQSWGPTPAWAAAAWAQPAALARLGGSRAGDGSTGPGRGEAWQPLAAPLASPRSPQQESLLLPLRVCTKEAVLPDC